MTSVSRIGSPQTATRAQGAKSSGVQFRVPDAERDAQAVSSSAVVDSALGLLAVQMSGDALEQDRRAKRDGEFVLGNLRDVQIALLEGRDLAPLLARFEKLSVSCPADPGLKEIIDEIRLRAAVEAARQRRRQSSGLTPEKL